MSKRLEAHYDNRIYYFTVLERKPKEITVELYKTIYVFVQENGIWSNADANRMKMANELISIVVAAMQ